MSCRFVCEVKKDICNEVGLDSTTQTTLTVTVSADGNIDFTDPDGHFDPVLSADGELSGSGTLIDRFYVDPNINLKFIEA